jgi:hypothetical protein
MIGVDFGRPGQDETSFCVICPACGMRHFTFVEPGPIGLMPTWLDCPCGKFTDLRTTDEAKL